MRKVHLIKRYAYNKSTDTWTHYDTEFYSSKAGRDAAFKNMLEVNKAKHIEQDTWQFNKYDSITITCEVLSTENDYFKTRYGLESREVIQY